MTGLRTLLVSLCLALTASSCVHSYPTPVAEVADTGAKIVQTAHALSLAAQKLEAQHVITTDQAAQVVIGAQMIETRGATLAMLLTEYRDVAHTVQGPTTAATIQRLLTDMSMILDTLNEHLPPGVGSSLSSLAASLFTLFGQIKAGLALAGA